MEVRKAKVLYFDENLGRGLLRLESGEKLYFTYKNVEGEGFVILFEGEEVEVILEEDGRFRIKRRDGDRVQD